MPSTALRDDEYLLLLHGAALFSLIQMDLCNSSLILWHDYISLYDLSQIFKWCFCHVDAVASVSHPWKNKMWCHDIELHVQYHLHSCRDCLAQETKVLWQKCRTSCTDSKVFLLHVCFHSKFDISKIFLSSAGFFLYYRLINMWDLFVLKQ